MDLREVARLVAEALGLEWNSAWRWINPRASEHCLLSDGSDVTSDYWRCRCEEWLYSQKFMRVSPAFFLDRHIAKTEQWYIEVTCPLAEAPARLVAAVWKGMKEKKG